jgi:Zn-dependent peptidase ImmA (M78 family)
MGIDLNALSKKLIRYRENFLLSVEDLSSKTGINLDRLQAFEKGVLEPNGDEILIFADIYRCDYKFFISNQTEPIFEEIDLLFRKHGNDIKSNDRWAIQECVFLAENEALLDKKLSIPSHIKFDYQPKGYMFKEHGRDAAKKLRAMLYPSIQSFNLNIYDDFKKIGINVFRRKLENSNISGTRITHPSIGKLILINYDEDLFRQRFTASHEAAHAILDTNIDSKCVQISSKYTLEELREFRADAFASEYLVPRVVLETIPENRIWSDTKLVEWAVKLKVVVTTLLIALKENGFIDYTTFNLYNKKVFVPKELKVDTEFVGLSPSSIARKEYLFENGITHEYVNKCANAYQKNIISISKMAELLLVDLNGLYEINELFKLGIHYES